MSRYLEAFGERKNIKQWSRDPRCVVQYKMLYSRVHEGMDLELAMTKPPCNDGPRRKTPDLAFRHLGPIHAGDTFLNGTLRFVWARVGGIVELRSYEVKWTEGGVLVPSISMVPITTLRAEWHLIRANPEGTLLVAAVAA